MNLADAPYGPEPEPKKIPVNCEWIEIRDYSLREAAAVNGIDAKFFDVIESTKYGAVEKQMRKLIADTFVGNLDGEWVEKNGYRLSEVRHGVYVILLGRGFEIDYGDGFTSPVVYIGKGGIRGRLVTHVRGKLFDFWRSIGGVPFRFFFTAFDLSGSDALFLASSLESHLIEYFDERRPEDRIVPLLNKKKGLERPIFSRGDFGKAWERPIKKYGLGRTTAWLLRPSNTESWKGALG